MFRISVEANCLKVVTWKGEKEGGRQKWLRQKMPRFWVPFNTCHSAHKLSLLIILQVCMYVMLEVISDPPPMNTLQCFCFLSSTNYVISKIFDRKGTSWKIYLCLYYSSPSVVYIMWGNYPGIRCGVGNIQKIIHHC